MKVPSTPKIDKAIFQTIFIDHWDSFKKRHPKYDFPQYDVPVRKMLGCGKESGGYSEYRCVYCGGDVLQIGLSRKNRGNLPPKKGLARKTNRKSLCGYRI